jgi:hypothetical protein
MRMQRERRLAKAAPLGRLQVFAAYMAYIGFWLVVASAAIYFGGVLGLPWWKMFLVAYVVFFVVNGSLAYVNMRRRLESEGKAPPSYLFYLFFPKGVPFSDVPLFRIPLGVVIFLGGLSSLALSVALVLNPPERTLSVMASIALALVAGGMLMYMGVRLVVARSDEPVLKRGRDRDGA